MTALAHAVLAFNLDWNIEIRAILVVGLAVVVLPGSIYMILATNLGTRLGFLVAMAGVFGWMTIMAIIFSLGRLIVCFAVSVALDDPPSANPAAMPTPTSQRPWCRATRSC